jgi:DNA-binding CsgD family transcriptional regulator
MGRNSLPDVASAIRSGRFAEAAATLGTRTDPPSLIERARLALLRGNFDDAVSLSGKLRAARDLDVATHLLARAIGEIGLAALGRKGEPLERGDLDPRASDADLIAYYAATAAYLRRDYSVAGDWLNLGAPKSAALRARHMLLQGLLAAASGAMKEQLKCAQKTLDLLESNAPNETYLIAFATNIIALLLRELAQRSGLARLERLERRLEWTEDLNSMHFQVLRTIGWSYALNSEYVPALTNIARSTYLLSDSISRMYSHLDRAMVSIFAGERTSAQADFETAQRLSAGVAWKTIHSEGVAVLPLAAAVASYLQLAKPAQQFCALAHATHKQIGSFWGLAHGPRLEAFIAEADALARASRNHRTAAEAARRAYATFEQIGYRWRAGRMATLLHTLTADKTWLVRAETALLPYSGSPFARELRDTTARELTTRQQEVLRLTLEGKSAAQIAQELGGISVHTVYNHQAQIKRIKGVRRLPELVATLSS